MRFLGDAAAYGCTKCKKRFPGAVGCMDYSGFDHKNWEKCSGDIHRQDALGLLQCVLQKHKHSAKKLYLVAAYEAALL